MEYIKQNFADGDILHAAQLNAMDEIIGMNLKKLENLVALNKGITYTESNDTAAAIDKTVPANVQRYAELRKIGGNTVVEGGVLKSAAVTAIKSYDANGVLIDTKVIPPEVQALPGYGWFANKGFESGTNDAYNEIDWVRRVYIQRVQRIDLGTIGWGDVQPSRFMGYLDYSPLPHIPKTHGAITCARYTAGETYPAEEHDKTMSCGPSDHGIFYISDLDYTDENVFRASLNGVFAYYELDTPVETNISNILPADNMIAVEPGGTIVFENANNVAANSTVSYMVKAGG